MRASAASFSELARMAGSYRCLSTLNNSCYAGALPGSTFTGVFMITSLCG